MTSENGVDQRLSFHCSCGATIETMETKETCPACGRNLEVIGCRETLKGKKYTLRITKRNPQPLQWPISRGAGSTSPTPDYNKRYTRVGLLTFLLIGLTLIASNISPEQVAILRTPAPRDCDWISLPLGNKHCHYERTVIPVGDQFQVTFQRYVEY